MKFWLNLIFKMFFVDILNFLIFLPFSFVLVTVLLDDVVVAELAGTLVKLLIDAVVVAEAVVF